MREAPTPDGPSILETAVHPKLLVSHPGDRDEREADRVAAQILETPSSRTVAPSSSRTVASRDTSPARVHRTCTGCGSRSPTGDQPVTDGLAHEIRSLHGTGRPLTPSTRSFFEDRLGSDFGGVRVHTDRRADRVARALNARAFTHGEDVAFRAGAFHPGTDRGTRLLAHELTHVAQQRQNDGGEPSSSSTSMVRRQVGPSGGSIDPMDDPRMHPEDTKEQQQAKANAQANKQCNIPSHCPAHFCTPGRNVSYMKKIRQDMALTLFAGIAVAVNRRVVSVWRDYLYGGSSLQDFSSKFGSDFENSRTTKDTTDEMKAHLSSALKHSPPSGGHAVVDISTLIPTFISSLDTPGSGMNFNIPGEVPGNLAGDIAKDQKQCPVGAKPSTVDDDRTASGTVTVSRTKSGDLSVTPSISYTVTDTVDLCPGNCGTSLEQFATVIMSQFEATGISGDVPFTVTFPAPMKPFVVSMGTATPSSSSLTPGGGPDAGVGSPPDAGPTDGG